MLVNSTTQECKQQRYQLPSIGNQSRNIWQLLSWPTSLIPPLACCSSVCVQLGDYWAGSQNVLTFKWLLCFAPRYDLPTWQKTKPSGTLLGSTLFCNQCFTPSYISLFSWHFIFLSVSLCRCHAILACLLTPFKGVNTEAIGLYTIIFDGLYIEVRYSVCLLFTPC